MRSRASLPLLEKAVMVMVFALSAALCLKVFLWSERISKENTARDGAVLCAQTAAELVKHEKGDFLRVSEHAGHWDGALWGVGYDEQWNAVKGEGAYQLLVTPEKSDPYLGEALVLVKTAEGKELFSLTVAWQEEK